MDMNSILVSFVHTYRLLLINGMYAYRQYNLSGHGSPINILPHDNDLNVTSMDTLVFPSHTLPVPLIFAELLSIDIMTAFIMKNDICHFPAAKISPESTFSSFTWSDIGS